MKKSKESLWGHHQEGAESKQRPGNLFKEIVKESS
jgi:hypothetical protein